MEGLCGSRDDRSGAVFGAPLEDKENFRQRRINIFEAPEFTQRLKTFLEVEVGKSATFVGYFRATPPPSATWVREEQVLCNNDKHLIVTDQSSGCSILTVTHVNRKDEGPYKCRLENKDGIASSTGYLSVIASKSRRSRKKGACASRVSSPPVLKSILEQRGVEEREAQEYVRMPPSPLRDFIAAIRHSARSMSSPINYAGLDGVPEEKNLESVKTIEKAILENNIDYQNDKQADKQPDKQPWQADGNFSAGETFSSETEATRQSAHFSSLSPQLGLDAAAEAATEAATGRRNKGVESGQLLSPTAKATIRISTASRTEPAVKPPPLGPTLLDSDRRKGSSFTGDKLDLYIRNNQLSAVSKSPAIANDESSNPLHQKQLQRLHQIQDLKLQKQQLRQQHQELQEQIKKREEQKLFEQKLRNSSEQRPLKLAPVETNDVEAVKSEAPPQLSNEERREKRERKVIEIKEVSKGLREALLRPNNPASVKSSLLIPSSSQTNSTPPTNTSTNTSTPATNGQRSSAVEWSMLDEAVTVWMADPLSYVHISSVIGVVLAALATDCHPLSVVVCVALASLIAFSNIPQRLVSLLHLATNHQPFHPTHTQNHNPHQDQR